MNKIMLKAPVFCLILLMLIFFNHLGRGFPIMPFIPLISIAMLWACLVDIN